MRPSLLRVGWLFAGLVFSYPSLRAEIIGVEQFDYPDGALAGKNGGTFWDYKNVAPVGHTGPASTWDAVTGIPAVTGGRFVTSGTGARREYNGTLENDGAVNDANVAKTVYYRVTVTTGATVGVGDYFGISSHDFGVEKIYFGKRGGSTTWGVEEVGVGGTDGSLTIQPNTTYLLVAQIDFPGDVIRLWVNPDLNAAQNAAVNNNAQTSNRGYTGTNWSTAVRLASGGAVTWDDLVVATTWEDLGTVVTTAVDEDHGSVDPAAGGGTGISLREAVKYSPSGTLITFAPGLSGGTIVLDPAKGQMLLPQSALTIDATTLPGGLTLDGNHATRHFDVPTGKSLTLRGLTLTRGNGSGGDGGSIAFGGTLNLDRCTFSGNASSGSGGAIASFGTLRATDCIFSENLSGGVGGGIEVFSGTAELTRCTLSGNTAGDCGALWMQGNTATLSHCTIAGNRSTGGFTTGGILSFSGTLTLQHCTISQNTGNGAGGGLSLQAPATVNVANCIIAGNADPGGTRPDIYSSNFPTLNATGTNLIGDNTSVEAQFPAGTFVGTAAAPKDAKLSPLGYFGGPVQTMHPLIGSLAIEGAGIVDIGGTDARGFPRFVDGDLNGTTARDLGAVEAGLPFRVENAGDAGGNTLRIMLATAGFATNPGARITFDPAVFPASTITLTQGELVTPAGKSVFIDASNLSGPVTISGNNQFRVFNIPATATVAMHSLRMVGGNATGNGGGIRNEGVCTVIASTLSGNTASTSGGGVFNAGTCTVASSTLSGNSAPSGSGLRNNGVCAVRHSTLSSNTGAAFGGGIDNTGACTVISSTLSGNLASVRGGGLFTTAPVTLITSIVAGNAAPVNPNIDGTATGINNLTTGDPLLAPLGDYGGPTQTMLPRRGSPALDAAGPVAEVQQITISPPVNFNLTFKGATTGAITGEPPTASAVQSALTALSTIGAGNVQVTSAAGGGLSTVFTVTFTGSLGGENQPAITGAGSSVSVTTVQDGNPGNVFLTDQRGFPRSRDGDGNGTATPDIGAVEAGLLAVTTNADANPGSLRAALVEAAALPGPDTVYFTSAVTSPVTLASEIFLQDATGGVTIDASDRPTGLLIDGGPGTNRHFRIAAGTTATFQRLRLTGGGGVGGGTPVNYGGSIHTGGTLTLRECTFSDNTSANVAGVIYNQDPGLLTIERCSFYGNEAGGTGAIQHESAQRMTVTASTFANNIGRFESGAINVNNRPATLTHCTISGNAVTNPGGAGVGGVRSTFPANLTVRDCIIAGNTDANSPGVPNVAAGFISQGTNVIDGQAHLAPLADFGGPTPTMALRPGSPAREAASTSTATTDQRGFPILGPPDAGAYEAKIDPVSLTSIFSHTGGNQSFTVPAGVTSLAVSLWGAGGGRYGGSGAFVSGLLAVTPGETLSLIVGGGGEVSGSSGFTGNAFGGGGIGVLEAFNNVPGGGGGGRSAIRNSGQIELVTAGAGGGGNAVSDVGGAGGLVAGNTSPGFGAAGGGGTQSAGGAAPAPVTSATAGSAFQGGNAHTDGSPAGGGGGGGFFGGGGGGSQSDFGGGGGGSSLFTSLAGFVGQAGSDGNASGSPVLPGGAGSPHYAAGIGTGGTATAAGGPGRIVLTAIPAPGLTNYNVFIWETLPNTATAPQAAPTFDFDGDGTTNEGEFLAGTTVIDPESVFRVKSATFANGEFTVVFPTVLGRGYRLEETFDLSNPAAWTLLPGTFTGTGSDLTLSIPLPADTPRYFLRPRVGP